MRVETTVTIMNRLGLHARPASKFAQVASKFNCHIWLAKDGKKVDGKSILEVLTISCPTGTTLTIIADGPDAKEAVAALSHLVNTRFDGMD